MFLKIKQCNIERCQNTTHPVYAVFYQHFAKVRKRAYTNKSHGTNERVLCQIVSWNLPRVHCYAMSVMSFLANLWLTHSWLTGKCRCCEVTSKALSVNSSENNTKHPYLRKQKLKTHQVFFKHDTMIFHVSLLKY